MTEYSEEKDIFDASKSFSHGVETGMGPITDRIINELINGFAIDNYHDKINDKFVDPITKIINRRMLPYVYLSGGLYIIIIVLLLIIIYMLTNKKR